MTTSAPLKRALVLAVRVAVIDGDFGLGNVDVMLGLTPQAHIGHVLSGARSLPEVLIEGPRGLQVLPSGSGVQPLTALSPVQRERFNDALEQARSSFDFIVIDTAPGIADNVIEMLRVAHHVLLVTSMDPAALVDAYALAKVLWRTSARADIGLVVNGVRDSAEGRLAFRQIDRAAARFLGHHLRYLGYVARDPAVRDAMLNQAALVDHQPQSPASRCFRLLANRLSTLGAGPGGVRLVPAAGPSGRATEVTQCG
jgi:flagellar biosynthesis protein FlhG